MRIWLDDVRSMPEGFDVWIKDPLEAMKRVLHGDVTFISFDHDLGEEQLSGYSVACCIEAAAHSGRIKRMGWAIHSANPVGRDNIKAAMERADYFWEPQHCCDCGSFKFNGGCSQGAGGPFGSPGGRAVRFRCHPACKETT